MVYSLVVVDVIENISESLTYNPVKKELRTPEYIAWENMIQRCYNSNHPQYVYYGGRGIRVCRRWKESFDCFHQDMGDRPSIELSLDRIDNNKDYEPSNCRWATRSQQQINRRRSRPFPNSDNPLLRDKL